MGSGDIWTVCRGRGEEKMTGLWVGRVMRPDQKDLVQDTGRVWFVVREEEVLEGRMHSSLEASVSIYTLSSYSLQKYCHHHHQYRHR